MFQTIEGMPAGVVAIRGVGRISAQDYETVLVPAVDRATAGGRKARLYLELGDGFEGYDAGGMLADTKVGMGNFRSFERIALVTDTDWIRHAVQLFGPLIPGDVNVFPVRESTMGREWVAGNM
jgi:hypothetical protein